MSSPRALIAAAGEELDAAGLEASVVVCDPATSAELALDPDAVRPVASLVKVPLAIAVLERIRAGDLDAAQRLEVEPGRMRLPGPMGLTRFRHPAAVAVDDLLYLSTSMSDNVAADALFGLVGPAEVTASMRALGLDALVVRQPMRVLAQTPAEALDDVGLAHALAIGSGTGDGGHPVAQLDVARANVGTARALAELLAELWRPRRLHADVAARVRELLAHNVLRQRLAPDFAADDTRWSSKTGTLLHLRHEMGVAEHDDGQAIAVVMLTESRVPAAVQPAAEATMALFARRLHDALR